MNGIGVGILNGVYHERCWVSFYAIGCRYSRLYSHYDLRIDSGEHMMKYLKKRKNEFVAKKIKAAYEKGRDENSLDVTSLGQDFEDLNN